MFRMASRLFAISEVRNKALRMLREEIVRDANHPSVAVWSIGNENASRPGTGPAQVHPQGGAHGRRTSTPRG